MSTLHMRNLEIHTYGELPAVGEIAPDFSLTNADLATITRDAFAGKAILINVYPSIDTNVCFESVKRFHDALKNKQDVAIVCVSMDLPFALKRIAEGESLNDIALLSDFRNREFGDNYGLTLADGPLAGLLARAVLVLDSDHRVVYHELVKDVTMPPNYQAALSAITK